MDLDVSDRIKVIGNEVLSVPEIEIGLKGSMTRVKRTFTVPLQKKERIVVGTDEKGIETVYQFLKSRGYV